MLIIGELGDMAFMLPLLTILSHITYAVLMICYRQQQQMLKVTRHLSSNPLSQVLKLRMMILLSLMRKKTVVMKKVTMKKTKKRIPKVWMESLPTAT
jgi:hypothetical protein